MKILHLLFHPNLQKSTVNKAWYQQIVASKKTATSRKLYEEYPDFNINVNREQEDLINHQRIVIQFPIQWYSVPPLLKKYMDDVLSYGFAYGSPNTKLDNKELQLIISAGTPEEAYSQSGYHHFTMNEFLRPLQQTFSLCKLLYLTPMVMYGATKASPQKIAEYGAKFTSQL